MQGCPGHAGPLRRCAGAIEASSGVPKEILVAIWGMETDFGADAGGINLFAALATLAYDGPRADYARPEFFAALRMYQEQHYPLSEMVAQLGRRLRPDPVHAHHLPQICRRWRWRRRDRPVALARRMRWRRRPRCWPTQGWKSGEGWGYEVKLPAALPMKMPIPRRKSRCRDWRALGVKTVAAPAPARSAAMARDLSAGGRAWAGLPAVRQFQRDPEIQQCRQLCPGGGAAGRPHGGRRARASCLAARRTSLCHATNASLPERSDQARASTPAHPMACWAARPAAALRQYQLKHHLPADGFATVDL